MKQLAFSSPPAADRAPPSNERSARWRVTVIDLDRTLTRRGTYTPFLLHVARRIAPWRLALAPAVVACMLAYKLGLLRRKRLKELMHRLMIGPKLSRSTAHALAQSFAEREVRLGCFGQGRRLIEREQAEGSIVILATAAHHLYASRIAAQLRIAHVVATESTWVGDTLLPAIRGENCHGPEKLKRILRLMAVLGITRERSEVRFYSDDASDWPIFNWCDQAIAVNPSPKLRAMSRARGWQILDWRRART